MKSHIADSKLKGCVCQKLASDKARTRHVAPPGRIAFRLAAFFSLDAAFKTLASSSSQFPRVARRRLRQAAMAASTLRRYDKERIELVYE